MSFQKWNGYPDSPVTTEEYPYQMITPITGAGVIFLSVAKNKLYFSAPYTINQNGSSQWNRYRLTGGAWVAETNNTTTGVYTYNPLEVTQCNYNIYNDSTLTTVWKSKTTTTPKPISSIILDPLDHKRYIITLASPAGEYQKWSGYPDSPVKTADKPYQMVFTYGGTTKLAVSSNPMQYASGYIYPYPPANVIDIYTLNSNAWVSTSQNQGSFTNFTFAQANSDIYGYPSITPSWKTKTTPESGTPILPGETPKLSYAKAIITPDYQKWSGYPDSPVKTADYPYQLIWVDGGDARLFVSKNKMDWDGDLDIWGETNAYWISGSIWGTPTVYVSGNSIGMAGTKINQCNNDVYTNSGFSTVYKAKTTTDVESNITAADGGILANIIDFLITNNAVNIIPHLVSATTSVDGTKVILTFDMDMSAVTGKQAEFGVKAGVDMDGGVYQKWNVYPDSPDKISDYPYQFVQESGSVYTLYYSTSPFFKSGASTFTNAGQYRFRTWSSGELEWGGMSAKNAWDNSQIYNLTQANNDIYLDSSKTTVHFNKTTTPSTTLSLLSAGPDVDTYQKWSGYPDSPVKTSEYPYQLVSAYSGYPILLYSAKPLFINTTSHIVGNIDSSGIKRRFFDAGVWGAEQSVATSDIINTNVIDQANSPVYNLDLVTIYKAATASPGDPKKIALKLNIAGEYQKWSGYPDSPILTSAYPYQWFTQYAGNKYLFVSTGKFYLNSGDGSINSTTSVIKQYTYSGSAWAFSQDRTSIASAYDPVVTGQPTQANNIIYTNSSLTTTYFAKNTPITSTAITSGQTVKTSYTKGTVQSALGGALESYADQAVTNAVPSPYQQWSGLPDTPDITTVYPYQTVLWYTGSSKYILMVSDKPMYYTGTFLYAQNNSKIKIYEYNGSTWTNTYTDNNYSGAIGDYQYTVGGHTAQANADIYTDATLTTVRIAKTTV